MFLRQFHGMTVLYCIHVYPILKGFLLLELEGLELEGLEPEDFEDFGDFGGFPEGGGCSSTGSLIGELGFLSPGNRLTPELRPVLSRLRPLV